jgi:anhydro-N-acetylmuramic acid kinase
MGSFQYPLRKSTPRLIIGLMSGTSLDGLDIALCRFQGNGLKTKCALEAFVTEPYPADVKAKILAVFAKPQVDFHQLVMLNAFIGDLHGQYINQTLKKWKLKPPEVAAIASHGQTVFHAPRAVFPTAERDATFQIGDGDHLAVKTGIPVVSDFRQKHVAAGGEGAPLAVYGDYLLFSKKGEDRVLLNIGGIANFTWLPASGEAAKVFVTDTGPGNTLIDQAMRKFLQQDFDRDGAVAKAGVVHASLLTALLADTFFSRPFPKTTGPELFNLDWVRAAQVRSQSTDISVPDLVATLTQLTAATISAALARTIRKRKPILYLSGGGAHNPQIVAGLRVAHPDLSFQPMIKLGIPGDAKEAVLFAVLANERLTGSHVDFGKRSKVPSINLGKISLPD